MMNQKSIIELMKIRTSVRTYSDRPIEKQTMDAMDTFLRENTDNPFGASVRFSLIDSVDTPKKLGTYGFIQGAKTFFAGCVKKGGQDLEGFGFAFEKAVLFATSLGLGTCWLGGTFKRSAFEQVIQPDGEYLPAVSPIGYANDKKSLIEKAVAKSAGARKRKTFDALFFDNDLKAPLKSNDDDISTCLEMVRIGPSASNKQPWCAVRNDGKYHFFLKMDKKYVGNTKFGFCMQRIDMGIAACHFMLSANELGVNGNVSFDDPLLLTEDDINNGYQYSFTWS